ncbi:MAG: hypothetical protein IJ573_00650 [Clostridia bacterium]|nr:hypothetical protein [Clostridia bacterium]
MIYGLTLMKDPSVTAEAVTAPLSGAPDEPLSRQRRQLPYEGEPGGERCPLPSPSGEGGAALAVPDEVLPASVALDEVRSLRTEVADLRAMLVAQNALLEQVAQSLAQTRVSRSQETALRRAVRDRAAFLCDREDFSMAEHRKVSGAILATVRQLTGCRALGDVPAVKFDQVMAAVQAWDMPGALRKIRRRCEA